MPRYINRKRNHANTNRRPVASNLSVNAPEFIPTAADQRQREPIRTMMFYGHSSAPHSSGNDSNTTSSSATNTDTTVSTVTSSSSKSSQRDELISLLNSGQLDCVVCYERTANNEPIWSCRNCYQIFHLKCIMVWFLKSYNGASWRCPACQNEVNQKPSYVCFCGNLPNPFTDNVDIPHTCGQVCGAKKKNNNKSYECNHKCTILCHPGPCPQCMALVQRNCGCGKIKVYVQCGQSTPVSCQNVCSKQLNCKNHICEKICHGGLCDPCKKNCKQDFNATPSEYRMLSNIDRADAVVPYPRPVYHQNNLPLGINEEELRMLGINPAEVMNYESDTDSDSLSSYVGHHGYNLTDYSDAASSHENGDDDDDDDHDDDLDDVHDDDDNDDYTVIDHYSLRDDEYNRHRRFYQFSGLPSWDIYSSENDSDLDGEVQANYRDGSMTDSNSSMEVDSDGSRSNAEEDNSSDAVSDSNPSCESVRMSPDNSSIDVHSSDQDSMESSHVVSYSESSSVGSENCDRPGIEIFIADTSDSNSQDSDFSY